MGIKSTKLALMSQALGIQSTQSCPYSWEMYTEYLSQFQTAMRAVKGAEILSYLEEGRWREECSVVTWDEVMWELRCEGHPGDGKHVPGRRTIMNQLGEGGASLSDSKVCDWFAASQEEEQEMRSEVGKGLVTGLAFTLNGSRY